MKNNYTHVHLLLDQSGSMSGRWNDTVGSLRSYIQDQAKNPGEMTLSLVLFNTNSRVICDLLNVQAFNQKDLTLPLPTGGTALYDTLCREIDRLGSSLSSMSEENRPEKILFVVFTDGEERDSKIHGLEAVRQRIKTQTNEFSWNFSFLGCNFDAEGFASSVGINVRNCLNFAEDDLVESMSRFSAANTVYRSSNSRSLDQSYSDVLRGN